MWGQMDGWFKTSWATWKDAVSRRQEQRDDSAVKRACSSYWDSEFSVRPPHFTTTCNSRPRDLALSSGFPPVPAHLSSAHKHTHICTLVKIEKILFKGESILGLCWHFLSFPSNVAHKNLKCLLQSTLLKLVISFLKLVTRTRKWLSWESACWALGPEFGCHKMGNPWDKLVSQDGHIRELSVQLRDPASVCQMQGAEQ